MTSSERCTLITDAENLNQLWADLIVEELVRCGVRHFCISPGSRSSPLVVAVARNARCEATIHFDERGTAFFALGYGRADRTPAAVITTSGTAVANCYPAIVEASADGVPMLVLTCDRPPELRKTGANQTVEQPGAFGRAVVWDFDFPAPSHAIDPAFVLTTVDQAVHRAVCDGGAVHLNMMYREPLAPQRDPSTVLSVDSVPDRWLGSELPFTTYPVAAKLPSEGAVQAVLESIARARRGAIVAGRLRRKEDAEAARELAIRLGWPLIPDLLSGSRLSFSEGTVPYFDLLLQSHDFREAFRPDTIIHLGARATSKRLYEHLASCEPEGLVLVAPDADRIDPMHRVTLRLESDVASFCARLVDHLDTISVRSFDLSEHVASLTHEVDQMLERDLSSSNAISEPTVARAVARHVPSTDALFVGASLPVRELDMFSGTGPEVPVGANRGASGIDGTVASAAGFAAALRRPVTLLLGDLALLHDLNSLALLDAAPYPVTIVVVNNDGGGVFSFLPIARSDKLFERYFATPHGLNFEAAAAMFDLPYHKAHTTADFLAVYRRNVTSGTSSMIEVRTDREANRAFHDDIMRAVQEIARGVAQLVAPVD